jgi:hypothetical protein
MECKAGSCEKTCLTGYEKKSDSCFKVYADTSLNSPLNTFNSGGKVRVEGLVLFLVYFLIFNF